MAAIHDLARELQLSISTVSRALAGKPNVNPATRARVLAAARQAGYAPNRSGRSLRRGATNIVNFVLSPHPQLQFEQPFFLPLLGGVQEELLVHGLDLVVTLGRAGRELEQIRQIVETRAADAVLLAWTRRHDERIEYLANIGFPFATLGRSLSGGAFPSLDIDFATIGKRATGRLLRGGHRRVALVNTAHELMFSEYLEAGYRAALAQDGIPADPALIRWDPMSDPATDLLMRDLLTLTPAPTAFLLCGETVVAGAYRSFAARGIRPGRDVAAIVMVDSPLCTYLQPPLTAFQPPLRELGMRLAQILLAAMPAAAGADGPCTLVEVQPIPLVERGSDGPVELRLRLRREGA